MFSVDSAANRLLHGCRDVGENFMKSGRGYKDPRTELV